MPVTPHENDVLLGKGHFVNYYPGNVRFRRIADEQKPHYFSAKKRKDKRNAALRVMEAIQSSNPPGRFLADSSGSKISVLSDGVWEVAEPEKALQKVLHRLRDNKGKGDLGSIGHQGHQGKGKTEAKCQDNLSYVSKSSPVSSGCITNSSDGGVFEPEQSAAAEIAEETPEALISDFLHISHFPHTFDKNPCIGERSSKVVFSCTKSHESDVGKVDFDSVACSDVGEAGDDISGIFSDDFNRDVNDLKQLEDDIAFEANFGGEGDLLEDDISGIFSSNFEWKNNTEIQPCREISLRQWIREFAPIESSRRIATVRNFSHSISEYINTALLISSKITKIIVDADQPDRNGSFVPLASIASQSIMIGVRQEKQNVNVETAPEAPPLGKDLAEDFDWDNIDSEKLTPTDEIKSPNFLIQHIRLDFPSGGNLDLGSITDRLYALGFVFVELFAFGNHIVDEDIFERFRSDRNTLSFGDINLGGISHKTDFSRHKKHSSDQHMNIASEIVNKLTLLGIPRSLCALLEDLLECNQGEFRKDDAYVSLEDLYSDLQLMIKEPSKFLYNEQGPQLLMSDKIHGRDEDIANIREAYKLRANGDCVGVVITGEAGVGKSRLAKTFDTFDEKENRRIFIGKFDQIYHIKPLSVIATVINDFCMKVAEDVRSLRVKQSAILDLENALGSQAVLLSNFLPSLSDLMTLDITQSTSSYCTDTAESVRFLFCKTLQILSSYSPGPITILLDDVQWADPSSLLLITSLLQSSKENKCVFFIFCIRDNEIQRSPNSPVFNWYQSTLKMQLKHITLTNLNEDGVNSLVSDTLCLFPRLTRDLSQVLHHRALGNPFFVWQLLDTLQKEGYLYHSLRGTVRRWMWDMDKISNLRISDNVLALLMREMNKLPSDLKMGLEVASCMGATVSMDVVRILSSHLKVDLSAILQSVTGKGFMDRIGSSKYRFAHDRVQQAAYEMMTDEKRRENHMTFGLAICSKALGNGNDELLFTSVNQINRGGHSVLSDPRKRAMIAALNLKVGTKSAALTDFDSALAYFKHGISFLNEEHWKHQYRLSIDLHNSAADASCALSDTVGVRFYSQSVFSHAVSLEDKLDAMFVLVKSLRMALALSEAEKYAIRFLHDLGEEQTRAANDPQLKSDILSMIRAISRTTDDSILNMKQSRDKKLIILMKLYHDLFYTLKMMDPSRLFSISLRMLQLSIECGITELSPLAFAQFGVTVLSVGDAVAGYRMGSLALKLAKSLGVAGYMSSIIAVVQPYIAWVSEPFQIITETHKFGVTIGERWGDVSSSTINHYWFQLTKLLSGQDLLTVRSDCNRFLRDLLSRKQSWCVNCTCVTYIHSVALIEGEDLCERVCCDGIPTEKEIAKFSLERKQELITFGLQTHRLMRCFLFRKYEQIPQLSGILENLTGNKIPLLSLFIVGIFYEGLASFCMARRTGDETWVSRGDAALRFLRQWSILSEWNFENKVLLLEAEKSFTQGDFDEAREFYKTATISAQRHKFIHEEAISHELAGLFFLDKKQYDESLQSLINSLKCFKQWGATAVAKRVEALIKDNFEGLCIPEDNAESFSIVTTKGPSKRVLDCGLSV